MDDDYGVLPEDPDAAFVQLEKRFREALQDEIDHSQEPGDNIPYIDYMSSVLAAASELDIRYFKQWNVPSSQDFNTHTYVNFRQDVKHYLVRVRIRRSGKITAYSVRLEQNEKQKIRHYVEQIRQVIDSMEAGTKKDGLFQKLNAFQAEVDKDRTPFEAVGDFVISLGGVVGEAAEKMKPAVDSIVRIMYGAKEEEAKQLPSPREPKQIEPPAKRLPKSGADEEIPF